MADITITPANVKSAGGTTDTANAGVVIAAGQVVYKRADKKLALGDNNDPSDLLQDVVGIALNGAALDQPVNFQKSGKVNLGGGLVKGTTYVLSATPGGIAPQADVATGGEYVILGIAESTTVLDLAIKKTNITL